MTAPPSIPVEHARRLALHAQGLAVAPPRRRVADRPGPEEVAQVVERIGCVQLDPVSAIARSPLLVLHARLGPFDDDALDAAAYAHRLLFDFWAHEASLVHVADLALHRYAAATFLDRPRPWQRAAAAFLTANEEFADAVVEDLRARGPLRPSDLEDASAEPWRHGWWTDEVSSRQTIARMLDVLWLSGRIGVYDREGTARRWHVAEACLPAGALDAVEALDPAEFTRRAALRAIGMLGVAKAPHIRAHFLRRRYDDLEGALERLADAGALARVRVAGTKGTWYARPQDLDGLADLPEGERLVALSPFDNLICDRARAAELFDFDHRLEIYVPASKRVWGYYVLPILRGERFIARADVKLDRVGGRLHVPALHREPGVRGTAAALKALEQVARWRGAREVVLAE